MNIITSGTRSSSCLVGLGEGHQPCQIAVERGLQTTVAGCQHDPVNEPTDDLARLRRCSRLVEGRGELAHFIVVEGWKVGMQPKHGLGRCRGELGGGGGFLLLQDREPFFQSGTVSPILDCSDDAGDFAVGVELGNALSRALRPITNLTSQLPGLDTFPEIVVDNPKLGNFDDFPLTPRVGLRDPLAGARILDVAAPVPFEASDIQGVIENSGAAVCLTSDRRVAPGAPAGDVERRSNRRVLGPDRLGCQ